MQSSTSESLYGVLIERNIMISMREGADNTVYYGPDRPSHIVLPIIPPEA